MDLYQSLRGISPLPLISLVHLVDNWTVYPELLQDKNLRGGYTSEYLPLRISESIPFSGLYKAERTLLNILTKTMKQLIPDKPPCRTNHN